MKAFGFSLNKLKMGIVDKLESDDKVIEYVYGRNPYEVMQTRKKYPCKNHSWVGQYHSYICRYCGKRYVM